MSHSIVVIDENILNCGCKMLQGLIELQSANIDGHRNYFITASALGSTSAMVLHGRRHSFIGRQRSSGYSRPYAHIIFFPIGDHVYIASFGA